MSTIDKLNLKDSTGSGILDLRNVTQINEMKLGNPEEGPVDETFNPLMGTGEGKLKNRAVNMTQIVREGDFKSSDNWIHTSDTATRVITGNECTLTLTTDATIYNYTSHIVYYNNDFYSFVGHRYLYIVSVFLSKQAVFCMSMENTEKGNFDSALLPAMQWQQIGHSFTVDLSAHTFVHLYPLQRVYNYVTGDYYKIRNFMMLDLTTMGLEDEVTDLASFKKLFGYSENEEMPFIPSIFKGVYFDSEGTVRDFPDDKFPFLRLKALIPPSLTDLNVNFRTPVIVPTDAINNYAMATNWKEMFTNGAAGSGVTYQDFAEAYKKTVAKYGSGVYDGTSKSLLATKLNALFPDEMKYWLGFGLRSFTLGEDGNPLLQIEPEDLLDDEPKKLEEYFPDTCPDEDKVYWVRGLTDMNASELLTLMYNNGMIAHKDYAYKWEIHNINEIPDNFANGNKNITDISFLGDTKVETIGKSAFQDCSNITGDFIVPSSVKEFKSCAFWKMPVENVYYNDWGQFYTIRRTYNSNPGVGASHTNLYINKQLVTSIAFKQTDTRYLYQGYASIKSVTFGSDITRIDDGMLSSTGITDLVVPDNVISIHWETFAYTQLKRAILGAGLQQVGCAFYAAPLSFILFKGTTPPNLANDHDLGYPFGNPIYVPVQSLNLYKTAESWDKYTNLIPYNIDCDPLGLISDNGARECYCPMSNLDIISEANYDSGTFKAIAGSAEGTQVAMRHYLSDGSYTEQTWAVKSDLTISL